MEKVSLPCVMLRCKSHMSLTHDIAYPSVKDTHLPPPPPPPHVEQWIQKVAQHDPCVDILMCTHLLQWSRDSKTLFVGMFVHDNIVQTTWDCITSLETLLVQMYIQCGSFIDALVLFKKMNSRSSSLWNFVVKSYALNGDRDNAFDMFEKLKLERATPSKSTCIRLLSLCSTKDDLSRGKAA